MKKGIIFTLVILPALLGTSCNDSVRQLNVYRQKGVVDKQVNVRFFKDSPNVPYMSVHDFYNEFYKTDLTKWHGLKSGFEYMYFSKAGEVISFSKGMQTLTTNGIRSFENHPDFIGSTGKLFLKYQSGESTDRNPKQIDLSKYSIKMYARQGEAYLPLTLLSDLSGGPSGYDIAYNGKDIYVFDYYGYLGNATNASTFGTDYTAPLNNINEARPEDLVKHNYNELCLVFDNLRGYTKQLVFGDDNLLSLGLDNLLSTQHPKIKEYLLSRDKSKYYEGLVALFKGLFDGGHTGLVFGFDALNEVKDKYSEDDFKTLAQIVTQSTVDRTLSEASFKKDRAAAFEIGTSVDKYYKYDSVNKTAVIGFNSFALDLKAWDNYYNGIGEVPVNTDTYAYIRSKMYQAKDDGAENLMLDLTCNGGGSSYALEGILGLFNNAKGYMNMKDVVGGYTAKEIDNIDINLDGKWDALDEEEAAKFNFNVGVLTSKCAFSCGNLLPFNMKELGYKILGEKSGGGSCAVSRDSTADGVPYAHSNYLCLTDKSGENIDGGVPVDFAISRPQQEDMLYDTTAFFDITSLSNYLKTAYVS